MKKPVKKAPPAWALCDQDRDSPIYQLEHACQKKIEEQGEKFKGVILIPNGEPKIAVENMLAGAGHKFALLFVVLGKVPSCSVTRVPGVCGGRVSFLDAYASEGLTAPAPKALPAAVTVEAHPSTVVLCKIRKPFASIDEWKTAERRPQAALTLWAQFWILGEGSVRDKMRIADMLARVPSNEVDLLLGASGSAGWLVDAFKTTACPPWQSEWQQREDGEDDLQYLHRLRRSHSNLGIAAGSRQLGLMTCAKP